MFASCSVVSAQSKPNRPVAPTTIATLQLVYDPVTNQTQALDILKEADPVLKKFLHETSRPHASYSVTISQRPLLVDNVVVEHTFGNPSESGFVRTDSTGRQSLPKLSHGICFRSGALNNPGNAIFYLCRELYVAMKYREKIVAQSSSSPSVSLETEEYKAAVWAAKRTSDSIVTAIENRAQKEEQPSRANQLRAINTHLSIIISRQKLDL